MLQILNCSTIRKYAYTISYRNRTDETIPYQTAIEKLELKSLIINLFKIDGAKEKQCTGALLFLYLTKE